MLSHSNKRISTISTISIRVEMEMLEAHFHHFHHFHWVCNTQGNGNVEGRFVEGLNACP